MMIKLEYDFQISGPYTRTGGDDYSVRVKLGSMYTHVYIPLKCFETGDFSCYTRDLEKAKLALIAECDFEKETILKTKE
jgi:hypothetical protein